MTKATTAKTKKKRSPGRKAQEEVYYVVAIESWEWSYSFGVNWMKDRPEPYSEYRHLHLIGKLLRPTKIKANAVRLIFMPDDAYNQDQWHRHRTPHVGTLKLYRGEMEGLIPLPTDVLPSLLTTLAADKIRFAVIQGDKMERGHAGVQNFRIDMSYDDGDLPPED